MLRGREMSISRSQVEYLGIAELRRRLLDQESPKVTMEFSGSAKPTMVSTAPQPPLNACSSIKACSSIDVAPSAETGGTRSAGGMQSTNGGESMSEQGVPEVAKLFESTKSFEEKLARLRPVFDQTDRLGSDAIASFESMVELAHSLGRLGEAYGPVRTFQAQMAALAKDFEPIGGVQKIFADVSASLREQLTAVAAALEPAKKLQTRLAQLAAALEPAFALQSEFESLAEVFGPAQKSPVAAVSANGSSDFVHVEHSHVHAEVQLGIAGR